ncbi:HNH endonuclease, partial [Limosilactobacillus reuteri]
TVDHIVPIAYDSTIRADQGNLATICRECHRLKTQWEQYYYGTAQNIAKKDVTEIHDIHRIVILMHQK